MTIALSHVVLPYLLNDSFNDQSDLKCAQFIRSTLKGTSRLNHIAGEAIPKDDPNFQIWDNDDSQIMTWLRGSMTIGINRDYRFYSSALEIGEGLGNTFSMCHLVPSWVLSLLCDII
ncbi:hypothetical protein VIGAN_09055100 [Vigna angularis var. angularis]|uniref:Uncharacterized protein n=1 Tax=Vigna angularis var. angularis TaxID=157739 RepID=A0A0S3SX22_PHAAN|nr:hypothetical protein VIGAN_09055100 [Vigna angularis var. angularis]